MTDPDPAEAAEAAALRVLVVSADETAAGFVASLLRRDGYDADVGAAERAAADTLAADPPYELVVVDTEVEPVRSIRSLADADRARVAIAVLGEPDGPADAETAATAAGADTWVARPVDDTELLAAIHRTVTA